VSGGHVHPNKTPFCEAVEMKKYLVEVLKIPSSDIIIEPHARHTTTNLRNANRLVYQFKMPANKPVMIVSDASQTRYINGNMKVRIQKELGYLPWRSMKQLSSTETEYLPSEISTQINPLDPLDP
ncbi:MAG: YdcF family protein, partial [Chitinophagaceae bacterium]|nr:YdcF family protein [Chitinophagaceae bacterium]